MSRYDIDISTVAAGFLILPKDTYKFEIGKGVPFEFKDKITGEVKDHGVRIPLKVLNEGEFKDKKIQFNGKMSGDWAGQTKELIMAAYGYSTKAEREFNTEFGKKDWSYNPEDKSIGGVWAGVEGKIVVCNLDVKPSKDLTQEFQSFRGWTTYQP